VQDVQGRVLIPITVATLRDGGSDDVHSCLVYSMRRFSNPWYRNSPKKTRRKSIVVVVLKRRLIGKW
jgi:hypothetical protein